MANTITNIRQFTGHKHAVQYMTLVADGATDETGYVLVDCSAIVSDLSAQNTSRPLVDPLNCQIRSVRASVVSAAGKVNLLWDATTPVEAMPLPANHELCLDFCDFGGLQNMGGAGRTGDILMATDGLEAGDTVAIIIDVAIF